MSDIKFYTQEELDSMSPVELTETAMFHERTVMVHKLAYETLLRAFEDRVLTAKEKSDGTT